MIDKEYLAKVKSYPKKTGKAFLVKYLEGKKIYRSEAISAKCYDCNGMGESDECDIKTCPLYPYSPYKV